MFSLRAIEEGIDLQAAQLSYHGIPNKIVAHKQRPLVIISRVDAGVFFSKLSNGESEKKSKKKRELEDLRMRPKTQVWTVAHSAFGATFR